MTPPQTTADVLDAAADLLSAPGAWTQRAYARGRSGRPVDTRRSAVCFCLLGAISHAHGQDPGDEYNTAAELNAVRESAKLDWSRSISHWNDAPERTQAEVVAVLRKAAAAERAALSDMQPTVAGEGVSRG